MLSPPLSIPLTGLKIWLDANDSNTIWANDNGTGTVSNGGTVGRWSDISGSGNHVLQSTSGYRPTYNTGQINGLPTILFDGVDNYLSAATFDWNRPETIYIVVKRLTDAGTILDGYSTNYGRVFRPGADTAQIYAGDYGASKTIGTGSYFILKVEIEATQSSMTIDNGVVTTSSGDQSTDMDGFTLASTGAPGDYANLEVAEVIGYDNILSYSDDLIVWNYLGDKYNITI